MVKKPLGKGYGYGKIIEGLTEEVHDHNKRLDNLNDRMIVLETDLRWVKLATEKIDSRTWHILAGVVISILLGIGLKFI